MKNKERKKGLCGLDDIIQLESDKVEGLSKRGNRIMLAKAIITALIVGVLAYVIGSVMGGGNPTVASGLVLDTLIIALWVTLLASERLQGDIEGRLGYSDGMGDTLRAFKEEMAITKDKNKSDAEPKA